MLETGMKGDPFFSDFKSLVEYMDTPQFRARMLERLTSKFWIQYAPKMSNRKLHNDLEELKKEVEKLRKELAERQATPAPVIHVWPQSPAPNSPPIIIPQPVIPQPSWPGPGTPWHPSYPGTTLPDVVFCGSI